MKNPKRILISLLTLALLGMGMSAMAEAAAPQPDVKELGVGTMRVYDFGDVKLHAYQTKDPIDDQSFLLETETGLIGIESPSFKDNLSEYADYITSLGKPLNNMLLAYHPAGADVYEGVNIVATATAQAAAQEGGSVKGLIDNFVQAFGDAFDGNIPAVTEVIEPGTITLDGLELVITDAVDGFDIEIPSIHVVFTHMVGSKVHNILASVEQIDAMIAQMKHYQDEGAVLILTSHEVPETIEAAAAKIDYLEKTKELIAQSENAEQFTEAMNAAFPDYAGANYLGISAGMLFQ